MSFLWALKDKKQNKAKNEQTGSTKDGEIQKRQKILDPEILRYVGQGGISCPFIERLLSARPVVGTRHA